MTISADYAPNIDVGNAVTTAFAVNFPFGTQGDLLVTLFNTAAGINYAPAPVLNGSGPYDYSVSGTPNTDTGIYPSGTVTFNTAPPSTYKVVRERVTAKRQNTSLTNNGPFPAKTVEGAFDRGEMQIQEAAEVYSRAMVAPAAVQPASMLVPLAFFSGTKILTYDPAARALSAADPNATSAAASLAAFQALIATYGAPIATYRNILELFTNSEIAIIKAGTNTTDLTAKINTAMAANPTSAWFWPAGYYFLNNTISLPQGIHWIGAGNGVTTIVLGGSPWGAEQLNPNGITLVRGFNATGVTFLISNNGIRLNNGAGAIDDTAGTQYYIYDWGFDECEFIYNSAASTKTLLQTNKAFNGGIRKCKFSGGHVQIHLRGSDINFVRDCRMDNATDVCVYVEQAGTFASNNIVEHNDMNNPKNCFYRGNDRTGKILNNHMELDFSPGSTGTGGKMEAMIDIVAGNAFRTLIRGNNMDGGGTWADRWLRFRGTNTYSLVVEDNNSPGPIGAVDIGTLPYFTNGANRLVCIHRGNGDGDASFPMNTMPADFFAGISRAAILSAGRPGVSNLVGLGATNSVLCNSGDFILAADANAAHYIEWSDWSGWPANSLNGTFTINLTGYAATAGQVLNWEVYDNAALIASGTMTGTVANRMYVATLLTATLIATKLKIRVWNADTVRNGNFYVRSIEVLL